MFQPSPRLIVFAMLAPILGLCTSVASLLIYLRVFVDPNDFNNFDRLTTSWILWSVLFLGYLIGIAFAWAISGLLVWSFAGLYKVKKSS